MAKNDTEQAEQPVSPAEQERVAHAPDQQPGLEPAPAVAGAEQVQATMDAIQAQGYQGQTPDPTPDSHYTVAGVLAGLPTPETDPEQAAKAVASARALDASGQPAAPKDK